MPSRAGKEWTLIEFKRLAEFALSADGLRYWNLIKKNDSSIWDMARPSVSRANYS